MKEISDNSYRQIAITQEGVQVPVISRELRVVLRFIKLIALFDLKFRRLRGEQISDTIEFVRAEASYLRECCRIQDAIKKGQTPGKIVAGDENSADVFSPIESKQLIEAGIKYRESKNR